MLITQNLTYSYNRNTQFAFPDLDSTGLDSLLILGPSGCGKSTFLHLLGGLLKPDSGRIELNKTDLTALNGRALDKFRGQNIGIIFQKSHLIAALSVWDNLKMPCHLGNTTFDKQLANDLLEKLNIQAHKNKKPFRLSQGEQQRVNIARALMNRPKIVLADEPTSSLDDRNCLEVIDLLKTQAKEHQVQLIIVTHDNRLKEVFAKQIELMPQQTTH